jgi:hypothetical protein
MCYIQSQSTIATNIDNLTEANAGTINEIIEDADNSTDFSTDDNHELALNLMLWASSGDMSALNGDLSNYEIESANRGTPPRPYGFWTKILSIKKK